MKIKKRTLLKKIDKLINSELKQKRKLIVDMKNQKTELDFLKNSNRVYSEHIQELLTAFLGANWTPRDVIKIIPRPKILADNASLMGIGNKSTISPKNEIK